MAEAIDPTFYRSPSAAIAAPPERLAYVAALDPAGSERDAITVVDCDAVDIGGDGRGWDRTPLLIEDFCERRYALGCAPPGHASARASAIWRSTSR
jgi:hypothetical protein